MVEAEAEKTGKLLDKRFLLVGHHNNSVVYKYDNFRIDDDKLATLPTNLRKQHAALKKQQQKHDTEGKKLGKIWNAWMENVDVCSQYQRDLKNNAESMFSNTIRQAIIEIQFAEDAAQAKAIIDSLPTVAQIMGKL